MTTGVTSGDPLADRVMLWTYAQFEGAADDVALAWEGASDAAFTTFTATGNVRAGAHSSPVGRTRTLPAAGAANLSMAVMSCSNYPAGYFNAYVEVTRTDAKYAVHLGDFIYEYGAGGYASADAVVLGRVPRGARSAVVHSAPVGQETGGVGG